MSLNTTVRDGILFLQPTDSRLLAESAIQKLEREIVAAIEAHEETCIVLDFSQVQFMSSSMLGKLVAVNKKVREYKAKLKLANVSPDIREVFKITRLDKLFTIEADIDAARKSFLKKGLFG